MIKYETNPIKIRNKSFNKIKENISLDHLNKSEQLLATAMAQASGDLSIIENIRFSKSAIIRALEILNNDYDLICDNEGITCNLKYKYLKNEPLCFISKANVISQAKSTQQSRSLVAVDLWKSHLSDSIVIIGNESTALFRLLEIMEEQTKSRSGCCAIPQLIIATPAGFTGAVEAKDYLWKCHEEFKIPCITLLGTRGGNDIASSIMNCLLKIHSENNN